MCAYVCVVYKYIGVHVCAYACVEAAFLALMTTCESTKVTFSVPKELVVTMDETGMNLLPLRTRGWAPVGKAMQVVFHGKNDKRQFTFCPVVSAAAALVMPILLIWGGF